MFARLRAARHETLSALRLVHGAPIAPDLIAAGAVEPAACAEAGVAAIERTGGGEREQASFFMRSPYPPWSPQGGVASSTVPPAATRRTPAMCSPIPRPGSRPRPRSCPRRARSPSTGRARRARRASARCGEQQRVEAPHALLARALGEQLAERRAEPAALPVVDHRDRGLGDGRLARGGRTARRRRRSPPSGVEGDQRLVVGVVDLGQVAQLRLARARRPRS